MGQPAGPRSSPLARPGMPRAGWLAIGAIAAALVAPTLGTAAACGLACLGVVLTTLACRRHDYRRAVLVAAGAALVLGRAALGYGLTPGDDRAGTLDALLADEHRAVVVSLSAPQAGQQRAILELLPPEPAHRVYAWLPRYPPLAPFTEVVFRGPLEVAPEDTGFGEFLARSGVGYTARIRQLRVDGTGDSPRAELEQLRRQAADVLARALPAPQAGLAAGLLVGLRDLVARDVAADFRTSGLSHIVAISGFHLALVAALAGLALRGLARRPRSLTLLVLVWSYVLLAGGAPSVVRAALMATVIIGAREAGRASQAPAALGLAALAMLLVEPGIVGQPGFQLSLAATAGLLVWATPLHGRLRAHLPARLPALVVEGLAVSLSAQLATLPLVLLHFGRLSVAAPLANLLATPLVAPAMIAAGAALAAALLVTLGVPALVMAPFSLAAALALGGLISVANLTAALPFASLELAPPFDAVAAIVVTLLAALALRRTARAPPVGVSVPTVARAKAPPATDSRSTSRRWPTRLTAAAAGLAIMLATVAVGQPDGRLRLTVLDIGQGDAILLEGPAGGRILVDTGPDPDRLLALLDARLPPWDRRLDLVVLSHPHEDHVAGLALLLDRYRIGEVAEPGMIGLGPGDAAYRRRLAELGRQTSVLAAGDRIDLDGVRIDVRWPLPGRVPLRPSDSGKQVNNVSLVLDIAFGQRRFLLTGDVEEQIDPQLLALGLADAGGPLDLLKVAHHGSGTATTDAFVEGLRPALAVISAGSGNPYGHPSPRTVARLEEAGATLYRTDRDGSVEISTDGHDLRARASGGRPAPTRPVAEAFPGLGFCPIPVPSTWAGASSAAMGR